MNTKPEKRVERTPGLWRTVRNNGISTEVWELLGHSTMRIVFGNDLDVAYCPPVDGDDGNTNAAFIVRACNAHDRLLEACRNARSIVMTAVAAHTGKDVKTYLSSWAVCEELQAIDAALALANVDPDDPATLERTADAVIESGDLEGGA